VKFFRDTANLDEIRMAADWGSIESAITKPTLIADKGLDQFLKDYARSMQETLVAR
jgi:transaldolase